MQRAEPELIPVPAGHQWESIIAAVSHAGYLWVLDGHALFRVSDDGGVEAFAGQQKEHGFEDAAGVEARFNHPRDLCAFPHGLLIADSGNNRIRRVFLASRVVTTYAGDGMNKTKNGGRESAQFVEPNCICTAGDGSVFVACRIPGAPQLRRIFLDNVTSVGLPGVIGDGDIDWVGMADNELVISQDLGQPEQDLKWIGALRDLTVCGMRPINISMANTILPSSDGSVEQATISHMICLCAGPHGGLLLLDLSNAVPGRRMTVRYIHKGVVSTLLYFEKTAVKRQRDEDPVIDSNAYSLITMDPECPTRCYCVECDTDRIFRVALPHCKSSLADDMASLLDNEACGDVRFHVGGGVLHCVRGVLRSRSQFFDAQFAGPWADGGEGGAADVEIPDATLAGMRCVLMYLLCDDPRLAEGSVVNAHALADRFVLPPLKFACMQFLSRCLTTQNAAGLAAEAQRAQQRELGTIAEDYMKCNFGAVRDTVAFAALAREAPEVLHRLLQDPRMVFTQSPNAAGAKMVHMDY